MLGKLLKHEWIATIRRYALFYLVLGAMTLFAAVIHALPADNFFFNMAEGAVLVLYVVTVIGVCFCSIGMAVVRFYKNMVSDEGYLTFTLPAKVEELVLAKFLVAGLWQMITVALCIVSLFLVFVPGHIERKELFDGISYLSDQVGTLFPIFLAMLLCSLIYQLLLYYLSIAVGQLFGTYKILASVIAYCAISFVVEIAMLLILLGVFAVIGFDKMNMFMNSMPAADVMTKIYFLCMGWTIILGVVEYFVTCHLLKKKLNLA